MKAWIRDLVVALALAFIILQFIKPTIVRENSMEPAMFPAEIPTGSRLHISEQAVIYIR